MAEVQEQLEQFQEFIEQSYKKQLYNVIKKGGKSLIIDFSDLVKFSHELSEELLNKPDDTLKIMELALEQFDVQDVRVRFKDLPESQKILIRDIRSNHINRFIVFDGIVRQASEIRPQVTCARFECPSCGSPINILQVDAKFKEPSRCSCGRKGKFRLLSKELVDAQRLVVEEAPEDLEGGAQPKRLSIFLKEDLVEPKMEKKTTPGSKIRAIGVIKEIPVLLRTGGVSTRYELIAETNNITSIQEDYSEIEISSEEEEKIKALAKDPKLFSRLVSSIAPSIYGHEKIKEALILQLVGGVRKVHADGTITRGDLHCLLVGDPGSGKSQLLQFISKSAPKALLVSGKGATSAGLTATIVKDEFLKGWALEAGALVLCNHGIACLDEMDKLSKEDSSAMHQALEQQIISISKANIQATLRAQTTVLAAANPRLGRFDPHQTIASQIDLEPTLINRFDLIFPVRDLPQKEKDSKIASHVLKLHKREDEIKPDIPTDFLRKYISYVKQKIFPKLTDLAIDEIRNFYVTLRNSGTTGEDSIKPIPISARQLEALVRLAEGYARIRLSEKVTKKDAKRAIELLKHCLTQVGVDPETGKIDIDRISTGITASTRNKIFIVRDIMNDFEKKGIKTIPIEEIIREAGLKNINEDSVREVLERLKKEGEIFEPKQNCVQKI